MIQVLCDTLAGKVAAEFYMTGSVGSRALISFAWISCLDLLGLTVLFLFVQVVFCFALHTVEFSFIVGKKTTLIWFWDFLVPAIWACSTVFQCIFLLEVCS